MVSASPPPGCSGCRFVDKSTALPKARGPWRCTFEIVLPPLPASATMQGTNITNVARAHQSMGMWRGDGVDCPTREES